MSRYDNRRHGGGGIPNRWLNCPRKASALIVNKFLAFKTPLDSSFDDQVPVDCRFPPQMLFDHCKAKKINLGLWFDLTNTKRFYNKNEVEKHGCSYIKLLCRGHGETPNQEQTSLFIKTVENYISQKPLGCIAVHCTHGFNRTGFLIVSYLVEKYDLDLEVALSAFAEVRPPGIYKEDYINELFKRYSDIEDALPAPPLPDWYFEDEQACNSSNNQHFDSEVISKTSESTNSNKFQGKTPKFMEGIENVEPVSDHSLIGHLKRKVRNMCGWKSKEFPGCQPVSMSVDNMTLLREKPYRVSWKADGTRYMMLIEGENQVFFFDRDFNVFKVKGLTFPSRDLKGHLKNTLLDGEMVIDKFNGMIIPRYLAYDIVQFEGKQINKNSFHPDRYECIKNEIIEPRNNAIAKGFINKNAEPFSIRRKDFWPIQQAASLLGEKFAKSLTHEPDGLIFQPSKEEYVAGRCDEVLKWKPAEMNSVDFRMKIVQQKGEGLIPEKVCQLYVGQMDRPISTMKYSRQLKEYDGKIVECKFENNQWKFMRERTDKSFPNSSKTAIAVMDTIKRPVTKQMLLDFIEHEGFKDESDLMPPPRRECPKRPLNDMSMPPSKRISR